jgi:hypothetical protein
LPTSERAGDCDRAFDRLLAFNRRRMLAIKQPTPSVLDLPQSKQSVQKLLIAGAIFLFFAISWVGARGPQRQGMKKTIIAIGNDLIRETNSHRLRGLDTAHQLTISQILSSTTHVTQVVIDHHPLFGTTSESHMILSNDNGHSIRLDLRTDGSKFYHLLGCTSISEPRTNAASVP